MYIHIKIYTYFSLKAPGIQNTSQGESDFKIFTKGNTCLIHMFIVT